MTMSHLHTLTPLIGIIARERTAHDPSLYDDARQEGLIKAWTVEAERPDASRQYVLAAARNAIGDVVRGRPATGAPGHRGRADAADRAEGLAYGEEAEDAQASLEDPAATIALLQAEMAAHEAEIAAAVDTLPAADAALIRARFWDELTYREVAAATGTPVTVLQRRFSEHARPALREALAHLAEAA